MDGRKRLSTYKQRAVSSQAERRRLLADKRRKAQINRRFDAFAEQRGFDVPEHAITASSTPAPSRVQKLQEWRSKKNSAKNKAGNSNTKPTFKICTKVRYDDTHLYKPPESTKFNAPKGVLAIKSDVPRRQLRSHFKQNGAVMTALKDFASAMKVTNLPKKENRNNDVLNRTFEASSDDIENPMLVVNFPSKMDRPKQISESTSCFGHVPEASGMVETEPCLSATIVKCPDANLTDPYCGELLPDSKNFNCGNLPISTNSTKRNTRSKSARKSKKGSLKIQPELEKENNPINGQVILEDCSGDSLNLDKMEAILTHEKPAEYFWSLYKQAADKLSKLCTEWDNLKSEDMPENVKDSVDVAIGYAKLLRSQKLQQFADLITEHENKSDETKLKVLSSDLEGFWNVVNNQLQNIYEMFEKLSLLRENEWKSPAVSGQQRKNRPIAVKVNKAKGKTTSGLRSFLAQARRKVKDENAIGGQVSLLDHENDVQGSLLKPMSPVVMKVALRAKQLGSPKVANSATRSPLKNANHLQVTFNTPTCSAKETPRGRTKNFTPGNTPLRRSTRLASNLPENLILN